MGLIRRAKGAMARGLIRLFKLEGQRYAAAKPRRTDGYWVAVDKSINDLVRGAAPMIRSKTRQKVRDFPFFTRAVNVLVDDTVGSGVRLQARVKGPDGDGLAKAFNQKIEDAWNFWADEADEAGKLHLNDLMRLAKRQEAETGEFLMVKVLVNDPKRYTPFALRMYEPDQLCSLDTIANGSGNEIMGGVEYDKTTNRVAAYWLEDPGSWGKPTRVPASEVIHHFNMLRPGQLRGISVFAPAIIVADDLDELMGAEIDAAKAASKYMAIVTTAEPGTWQGGTTTTDPQNPDQKIEELENAIIQYLRPGEEIHFAKHDRPSNAITPYSALVLRMVAVTTDISYQRLSGDYTGINYSTTKGIKNDSTESHKSRQNRFYWGSYRPTFNESLKWIVLKDRISLPGYWRNPAAYHRVQWFGPPLRSHDEFKEARGIREEISMGINSPQNACLERGRDPDEMLEQTAEFIKKAEKLAVPLNFGSKPMKTNNAALEAESQ